VARSGGPDAGIDLVAQANDGTLWAIQAKAYAPDNTVTKHDVDRDTCIEFGLAYCQLVMVV